ncbi:MAG: sensor histidine kinase, partial [Chloroflexi bacterium]|nr:sensor histidine kinase [Chloroflexota bacterium]
VILFTIATGSLQSILLLSLRSIGGPTPGQIVGFTFLQVILYLIIGGILSRLVSDQRKQRTELAEMNIQLAQQATMLQQLTISHERNRMARDLHDTLAHSLTAVAVQLEAARALWDESPEEARAMLDQSLATTRQGLKETRRAIQDLRASPLEDLGLTLAIRQLAETTATRAGLDLTLDVDEQQIVGLSPYIEQGFYRIADEILANVERHAMARSIDVSFHEAEGMLDLTVKDDGRGFDPQMTMPSGHFGLKGMHERAAMIGGKLEISSDQGEGTSVRLRVRRA